MFEFSVYTRVEVVSDAGVHYGELAKANVRPTHLTDYLKPHLKEVVEDIEIKSYMGYIEFIITLKDGFEDDSMIEVKNFDGEIIGRDSILTCIINFLNGQISDGWGENGFAGVNEEGKRVNCKVGPSVIIDEEEVLNLVDRGGGYPVDGLDEDNIEDYYFYSIETESDGRYVHITHSYVKSDDGHCDEYTFAMVELKEFIERLRYSDYYDYLNEVVDVKTYESDETDENYKRLIEEENKAIRSGFTKYLCFRDIILDTPDGDYFG